MPCVSVCFCGSSVVVVVVEMMMILILFCCYMFLFCFYRCSTGGDGGCGGAIDGVVVAV